MLSSTTGPLGFDDNILAALVAIDAIGNVSQPQKS